MSRPVAALTSELLVRKGMAQPLGLEPIERTPFDVAAAVRPSIAQAQPNVHQLPQSAPASTAPARSRGPAARLAGVWLELASRWGLPSILFVAGATMVAVVAVTGSGPSPAVATVMPAAPISRPPGPTPVTWIDEGLMSNPALAGR